MVVVILDVFFRVEEGSSFIRTLFFFEFGGDIFLFDICVRVV